MRFPILATLVAALTLTACGGSRESSGTNLTVSGSDLSSTVQGGAAVTFTMRVSNDSGNDASGVTVADSVSAQLEVTSVACTAAGGAVCPETTGARMSVGGMPAGSSLTFLVTATTSATANGDIYNTMQATTESSETNAKDNSYTAHGTAVAVSSFGVTQAAAATTVSSGASTTFTATVSNPGPGTADNLTIQQVFNTSAVAAPTVTCTASSGATCPDSLGQSMTLASLPVGRFLVLTYRVTVPNTYRGDIVSTVTVTSDNDPSQLDNNTASATTTAGDSLSGTYQAYAADGNLYSLTIDFDKSTYTMSSATSASAQRSFTADASGGGYTVNGNPNSHFRAATDLLVGSHDFGTGLLPYVAARSFSSTPTQGQFNLATRNVSGTAAVTHAGTAQISQGQLFVCQTDDQDEVLLTRNCGSGVLKTYTLTTDGNVFKGIETTTGEAFDFSLAKSGDATILLSTGTAADNSAQFRIGLVDTPALIGGALSGASTNGDWISITMSPSSYMYIGPTLSESLQLQVSSAQGPFSMLEDIQAGTTYHAAHYVLQTYPLAVMVGIYGGTASGILQVSLP